MTEAEQEIDDESETVAILKVMSEQSESVLVRAATQAYTLEWFRAMPTALSNSSAITKVQVLTNILHTICVQAGLRSRPAVMAMTTLLAASDAGLVVHDTHLPFVGTLDPEHPAVPW
jgi:spore maturation protein SpmB